MRAVLPGCLHAREKRSLRIFCVISRSDDCVAEQRGLHTARASNWCTTRLQLLFSCCVRNKSVKTQTYFLCAYPKAQISRKGRADRGSGPASRCEAGRNRHHRNLSGHLLNLVHGELCAMESLSESGHLSLLQSNSVSKTSEQELEWEPSPQGSPRWNRSLDRKRRLQAERGDDRGSP